MRFSFEPCSPSVSQPSLTPRGREGHEPRVRTSFAYPLQHPKEGQMDSFINLADRIRSQRKVKRKQFNRANT